MFVGAILLLTSYIKLQTDSQYKKFSGKIVALTNKGNIEEEELECATNKVIVYLTIYLYDLTTLKVTRDYSQKQQRGTTGTIIKLWETIPVCAEHLEKQAMIVPVYKALFIDSLLFFY